MDTLWRALAFLTNNLLIIAIIFLACLTASLFFRSLLREARLNRRLFRLQKVLRQARNKLNKPRLLKQTALVLIPLVILGGYMASLRPERLSYTSHLTPINDVSDLVQIYQAYQHKSRAATLDILPSDRADDVLMSESVDTSMPSPVSHSLHLADEGQRLYILNDLKIQVIDTEPSSFGLIKQWSLTDAPISAPLIPERIFVDAQYLIVVGRLASEATIVLTYDRNESYTLLHQTVFSGNLRHVVWEAGHLYLFQVSPIALEQTDTSISAAVPTITHDGVKQRVSYKDIHYVEGTEPNGFLSIFHFDLINHTLESDVYFTDTQALTLEISDAFYLAISSTKFSESSEVFVVSNPVVEQRTVLARLPFSKNSQDSIYTTMVAGSPMALHMQGTAVSLLTHANEIAETVTMHLFSPKFDVIKIYASPIMTIHFDYLKINACTFLTAQSSQHPHYVIDWETGLHPVIAPPYSHVLSTIQAIQLDTQTALLIALSGSEERGTPEGIAIALHRRHQTCQATEVSHYLAEFNQFGIISTSVDMEQDAHRYYAEEGLLFLPFETYDTWPAARQMPGLLMFSINEDHLAFERILRHEAELSSNSTYRVHMFDNHLITVSRNHMALWHIDDLSVPIELISMP